MRLYEGTIQEFREDVIENKIADRIAEAYQRYYGQRIKPSEYNAWNNSLRVFKDALDIAALGDNMVILEQEIPYTERRIDALLFGCSAGNTDSIVIVELKQWSYVENCEIDGNVVTIFGGKKVETSHPSLQVEGYHNNLKDYMGIFEEDQKVELSSCVYCHNYSRSNNGVLFLPKFKDFTKKFPLFAKEDATKLGKYLKERLRNGKGMEVFNRFITSPIRPSKKLLDHTGKMIQKQRIFTLIDDQIDAYNAIMDRAKKLSRLKEKSVIIVKGGPGTGKSVIALEVMAELMRQGKRNVFHATGSSAFTKTLREIVGRRANNFFKFFFAFTQHKNNEIDVIICDEAHRIRKDSSDWGVPAYYKSKSPQVDDLIRPAKLSIFFIDEFQVVRPLEIGSVELIRNSAKKFGAHVFEYELRTQFRCSGSDSFLQWVENVLGIRESEKQFLTKEDKMEFKIFDSPAELKKAIDEKNKGKENSARLVAGFCWPWNDPKPDGTLVNDVVIGDFKMPWEAKHGKKTAQGIPDASLWAYHPGGVNQVGTVYTIQGFEFDYVGIIFGKDLVYDPKKKEWMAKPENSHDNAIKRNNKKLAEHLKNVYRVLMSRAHKGVYIYFMDENTRKFFESKIKK